MQYTILCHQYSQRRLPKEIGLLPLLGSLWLQGNDLTTLPRELAQCTFLTELIIDQNPLQTLPEEIGRMGLVRSLRINGLLTSFPAGLWSFLSLESLDLDSNNIDSLPAEIGDFAALRSLTARACGLTRVSSRIARLPVLEELDLSSNKLADFPECNSLLRLRTLALADNQLSTCPLVIGLTKSLRTVDLSGNRLNGLPVRFGMLDSLQTLLLDRNALTSIGSIPLLTSLTVLDLSNNRLTNLPEGFGDLTSLSHLDLGANGLSSLPASITRLTGLFPQPNPVSSRYPPDTIWSLDIDGNRLCSLDPAVAAWADANSRGWRATQVCTPGNGILAWEACAAGATLFGSSPAGMRITSIFVASSDAVFAGAETPLVFRSVDGGASWQNVSGALHTAERALVTCFAEDSLGTVYAATHGLSNLFGGVFALRDDLFWSVSGSFKPVTALAVSAANEVVAGTWDGIFMRKSGSEWDTAHVDLDSVLGMRPYTIYFGTGSDNLLSAVVTYPCARSICHPYLLHLTGDNLWTHDPSVRNPPYHPSVLGLDGAMYEIWGGAIVRANALKSDTISTAGMLTNVNTLAVSREGRIVALNAGGLAYARVDTGWVPFDFGLPDSGATALAFDTAGNIFAGAADGVYVNRSFAQSIAVRQNAAGNSSVQTVTASLGRNGPMVTVTQGGFAAATLFDIQGRVVQHFPWRSFEPGRHALGSGSRALTPGMHVIAVEIRDTRTGECWILRARAISSR